MKTYLITNPESRDKVVQLLNTLNLTKPWEIIVRRYEKKRNNEQNKLYWATLNEIAEAGQHSAEVWHEFFKRRFIGMEEFEINGEVITRGFSTTTLSVTEFADYVTQVQRFAASELGIA